jgi:hypothetical protein
MCTYKGDQSWAAATRPEVQDGVSGLPQTHFVRARTDDTWVKSNPEGSQRASCVCVYVWIGV